jgi:hypothetical protein
MAKTLKVNSRELSDLQLIIQTYEKKIAKQSNGEKVSILAYRPMENTQVTFQETYTGIDPGNEVGKTLNNVRRGMSDVENTVNNATVGQVTNAFAEMYKSGKTADREAQFQAGPLKVSTNNTIAGMVNAFQKGDVGKGFSVLLNDCIPCDLRFEAVRMTPDLSFLENIIKWAVDFIDEVRRLAIDLVAPAPIQADICAHLNLLNFTCLPDFNALMLTMGKGITTSLSLPKFKLPGLGDLISMIVVPILAMFANLAQTWISLVINPIDCLIRSIQSLVRKFRLPPGRNGAALNFNETSDQFNVQASVTAGFSEAQVQEMNKKFINPTVNALEQVAKFIQSIRNRVVNAFQKLINKYVSAMNQSTRSIFSLMSGIQEVLKIVSMFRIVLLLKSLFETKLTFCADREEALKKTYEDAVRRVNDVVPGKSTIETPTSSDNVRVSRTVTLTKDEADSLGFNKPSPDGGTVTITPEGDTPTDGVDSVHKAGRDTVKVKITRDLPIGDCSVISNREQFVSVDRLLHAF